MRTLFGLTLALAAFYLAAAPDAIAAPLRCSAEEKACISLCNNNSNPATVPNCILGCRTKMSVCRQTGCWGTGPARYCGLTRQ